MKNEPRHNPSRKEASHARAGRCIALIDSNYLSWLLRQTQEAGSEPEPCNRMALMSSLAHALKGAGLNLDIQRIYWYTDTPDAQFPQDQVVRHLDATAGEPGDVVFQAMTADMAKLAQHKACDHLLIASDDDRLTAAIDDVQLHGLNVHLLADESARHQGRRRGRHDRDRLPPRPRLHADRRGRLHEAQEAGVLTWPNLRCPRTARSWRPSNKRQSPPRGSLR